MLISRKHIHPNVEIKNKELKDVNLLEFEFVDSKVKIVFEYDEKFARKYNLAYWQMRENIFTIVHDFSDYKICPPFGIEIIVDYNKKEVYIM